MGKAEGRRQLGRPTLRWEDKVRMNIHGLDGNGSRQGQVAGSCKCDN